MLHCSLMQQMVPQVQWAVQLPVMGTWLLQTAAVLSSKPYIKAGLLCNLAMSYPFMLMSTHTSPPGAQASPQVASMSGTQRLPSEPTASYDKGLQMNP